MVSRIRASVFGLFFLILISKISLQLNAHLRSVRIQEIPFELTNNNNNKIVGGVGDSNKAAIARVKYEERSYFFNLFNIKYIVCFFAAKGKWPFIPSFMKAKVDSAGRSLFSQNDTFIQNYCKNWITVRKTYRPNYDAESLANTGQSLNIGQPCTCNKKSAEEISQVIYFDKNYIGNVSSDTIRNTIEFLEGFLPVPTKKPKKKNRVRNNGFVKI